VWGKGRSRSGEVSLKKEKFVNEGVSNPPPEGTNRRGDY